MKVKTAKYKAGSILLWKEYSLLRKVWYWLLRKKLPYNNFTVMSENGDYLKLAGSKVNEYLLEPKKIYSKDEVRKLDTFIGSMDTVRDLVTVINKIRPNTIVDTDNIEVNDLFDKLSKYYKVRHLLDEKEYSDYILPIE